MKRGQIQNAADALDYLADCTLATVRNLTLKKNSLDAELARQITIAQIAIDCMRAYGISATGRAETVNRECDGDVLEWVEQSNESLQGEQA